MSPQGPQGPDLNLVHRIDQAQASAFQRVDNLLLLIDQWINNQGFSDEEMLDSLDDPMAFFAVLQICRNRVSVSEYPNMFSAAILRIAKERLEALM